MNFDQICVRMILAWSVSKLNRIDLPSLHPFLKIAKYETGKISQWNRTSFVLQ